MQDVAEAGGGAHQAAEEQAGDAGQADAAGSGAAAGVGAGSDRADPG